MNQNKFRVWNDDFEQMFYSDKEYNDCFFGFDKGVVVAWFRKTIPQTQDEPAYDVSEPFRDVMQFTGLLDNRGKEAYCGDRVSAYGYSNWIIKWHNNGWMLRQEDVGNAKAIPGHFIVFGNVHENPELLEEKDE